MSTMKGADRLRSQLGGNIRESMATVPTGATGPLPTAAAPAQFQGVTRPKDALTIEVGRIVPDPDQPRKEFDPAALEDLAGSLKARGQLQPIRVRWSADLASWVIVSGERRWRAAQMAGLSTLACVEAKGAPTPDEILEDQIIENCIREDLKPSEQARAFQALVEIRGCSFRQLADYLKVSHMKVSRSLDLLKLPEEDLRRVDAGEIPASAAAAAARMEDDGERREILDKLAAGQMTRDEAVVLAREKAAGGGKGVSAGGVKGRGPTKAGPPKPKVFRTAAAGGAKVTIEMRRDGSDAAMAESLRDVLAQLEARLIGAA